MANYHLCLDNLILAIAPLLSTTTPQVVNSTIHTFYRLGFAQVSEWSKPQPTQNPGEVMSILSRRVLID